MPIACLRRFGERGSDVFRVLLYVSSSSRAPTAIAVRVQSNVIPSIFPCCSCFGICVGGTEAEALSLPFDSMNHRFVLPSFLKIHVSVVPHVRTSPWDRTFFRLLAFSSVVVRKKLPGEERSPNRFRSTIATASGSPAFSITMYRSAGRNRRCDHFAASMKSISIAHANSTCLGACQAAIEVEVWIPA